MLDKTGRHVADVTRLRWVKKIYVYNGRSDWCKRSRGHVPTEVAEVGTVEELGFLMKKNRKFTINKSKRLCTQQEA